MSVGVSSSDHSFVGLMSYICEVTHVFNSSGVVFTNIHNLSLILVIKFMTFVLAKIGPNLVFTKHVLARTIFLILS